MNNALRNLAESSGIEVSWRDVDGNDHIVAEESLIALLEALGLPASSERQISESYQHVQAERLEGLPPLITADLDEPIRVIQCQGAYKIIFESGASAEGRLEPGGSLPLISEIGYHRLMIGTAETIIAVAPRRGFTLTDVAARKKMWGLAIQLYSLRRQGGGGVGDYSALQSFVERAALRGADAVAISPVHAQFSGDVTRFGPYAPSNRAAYNIWHIAESNDSDDANMLIDWPAASTAKLKALRARFDASHDDEALEAFRKRGGPGLDRHAVFEALHTMLFDKFNQVHDWRQWPEQYRDPESAAVRRFRDDHSREIAFHAYLQFRADEGLGRAHQAARNAGMKIGLIADLAVGTDHAGSHSWSRQSEILRGLEIGAPPDAINREGQSWGITSFSPRGLVASGYSAFIEMLRHALRHAGGVRIDHVMGLARLWLIPNGLKSSQGAYLKMPVDDLIRIVTLESVRHQAIILGEDLGTLPHGFQDRLDEAGIAGLRVMWFERSGNHFTPPANWTKTAVAMTSTHDLPTVAGWWQGTDIAWREKLQMAGDNAETRAADRAELWRAFQESGAASDPIPDEHNGSAAADAACAHLGLAGCMLALLPIEDALGSTDQPNFPGTTSEHPNWCRRLPHMAEDILDQPKVVERLSVLHQARAR